MDRKRPQGRTAQWHIKYRKDHKKIAPTIIIVLHQSGHVTATRYVFEQQGNAQKCAFGRGSAPDPAGKLPALPDLLAGFWGALLLREGKGEWRKRGDEKKKRRKGEGRGREGKGRVGVRARKRRDELVPVVKTHYKPCFQPHYPN